MAQWHTRLVQRPLQRPLQRRQSIAALGHVADGAETERGKGGDRGRGGHKAWYAVHSVGFRVQSSSGLVWPGRCRLPLNPKPVSMPVGVSVSV